MGPMWDYNEAFGQCCGYPIEGYDNMGASNGTSGGSAISPEGWRFNICQQPERCLRDPDDGISRWYRAMWQEPTFREAAAARWRQLRAGPLSDRYFTSQMTQMYRQIQAAAMRNYQRWHIQLDSPFFQSHQQQFDFNVNSMHQWLMRRLSWLDVALA